MTQTRKLPPERVTSLLEHWARLGVSILAGKQVRDVNWTPVQRLLEAACPLFRLETQRLCDLLEKSNRHLHPFEDPLRVDFGVHRWLRNEREEAYSDWLEWVVNHLPTPGHVFRLFGIKDPAALNRCRGMPVVQREVTSPKGHVDQAGRLDIVIRWPGAALILGEVKTVTAEEADTDKHVGYSDWLEKQPEPRLHKHAVLLAVGMENENYGGFQTLSWGTLCVELRRMVPEIRSEKGMVVTGMTLAFIGAVEQNLLSFSAPLVHSALSGRITAIPREIVQHLECSLPKEV